MAEKGDLPETGTEEPSLKRRRQESTVPRTYQELVDYWKEVCTRKDISIEEFQAERDYVAALGAQIPSPERPTSSAEDWSAYGVPSSTSSDEEDAG